MQLKKRYIGGMLIMIIWTVYHIIIEQWGLASIGFVSLGIITIMLAWAYPSFLGLRGSQHNSANVKIMKTG